MLSEEHLIPYHASDLTGERVLCLAPHPDDETLGCGGALALHRKSGDPVRVIFLTDGAAGDSKASMEKDAYVQLRRQEAEKACHTLGIVDVGFWDYPDRGLAGARGALVRLIDLLNDYAPQLVYVPSPMEFHPDHRAACFLLCDAIHGHDGCFDVAFYELGQPIRVNRLVDITPVLKQKKEAIDAYGSQLKEQPYDELCLSLDRYRSMTLPESITHAEGFSLYGSDIIRNAGVLALPFQRPERYGPGFREAGPLVSVIIRTQNRPKRLAHALQSVVEQTYANLEVVLVNDGGVPVADVVDSVAGETPVTIISHEKVLGRSAAANSGLKAAKGKYLNFLDDDDVFYPHHVETLVRHLETTGKNVAYAGVLNVYFKSPPESPGSREREELVFNFDYNPDRLLFENYIPLMSVMFTREAMMETIGFSEELVLFEDWDFWIRMSQKFTFYHVDEVTAEYRFYSTGGMTESHRRKYDYDRARGELFNRARPFMTGNAWANYQRFAHGRAVIKETPEERCISPLAPSGSGPVSAPADVPSLTEEPDQNGSEPALTGIQNHDVMAQNGLPPGEPSELSNRFPRAVLSPVTRIFKNFVSWAKSKRGT